MENRYLKMDIKYTDTIKIKRLKIESTLMQLKINIRKQIEDGIIQLKSDIKTNR